MDTNEARSVFKKRFSELRGGRTQAQFAEFLGIARPTVGFYENGDRIPDAQILAQIADRCAVPTDYLVGLSDVRSRDIDVQAAHKKYGLSEAALMKLEKLAAEHDRPMWRLPFIFSKIIESESFRDLLTKLSGYCIFSQVEPSEDPHIGRIYDLKETLINLNRFEASEIFNGIANEVKDVFSAERYIEDLQRAKEALDREESSPNGQHNQTDK